MLYFYICSSKEMLERRGLSVFGSADRNPLSPQATIGKLVLQQPESLAPVLEMYIKGFVWAVNPVRLGFVGVH